MGEGGGLYTLVYCSTLGEDLQRAGKVKSKGSPLVFLARRLLKAIESASLE